MYNGANIDFIKEKIGWKNQECTLECSKGVIQFKYVFLMVLISL